MKLYHISPYSKGDSLTKTFIPRIPDCPAENENKTIPRICFSETVEGCFDAIPTEARYKINAVGEKFLLYEIETSDYPESSFILNKEIVAKNLVLDANTTKECWLLKPVSLKGKLCVITDIERDFILDYSVFKAKDVWAAAEEIDKTLSLLFNEDEMCLLDTLDSEQVYTLIIQKADQNKRYDICDDLLYVLGANFPNAQRIKTKISFSEEKKKKPHERDLQ